MLKRLSCADEMDTRTMLLNGVSKSNYINNNNGMKRSKSYDLSRFNLDENNEDSCWRQSKSTLPSSSCFKICFQSILQPIEEPFSTITTTDSNFVFVNKAVNNSNTNYETRPDINSSRDSNSDSDSLSSTADTSTDSNSVEEDTYDTEWGYFSL